MSNINERFLKESCVKLTILGAKIAVNPSTKPILATFEPKSPPIEIPTSLDDTAETETANSGREVITDKIRNPTAISPSFVILDIAAAELETRSLDFTRKNRARIKIVN